MNRITAVTAMAGAAAAISIGGLAVAADSNAASRMTADSYTLTSSNINVGSGLFDAVTTRGYCAIGYHVRGTYQPKFHNTWKFEPTLTLGGDSDVYVKVRSGVDRNGGTSNNGADWTYRGLEVTLGNHSWSQDKTGSFSWTCDPN